MSFKQCHLLSLCQLLKEVSSIFSHKVVKAWNIPEGKFNILLNRSRLEQLVNILLRVPEGSSANVMLIGYLEHTFGDRFDR